MWHKEKLENMADICSGGTPSRDVPEFWKGSIPWVTPTDITKCKTNYLTKTVEKITDLGLAKSSSKMLPPGSILLTSRATVGEARLASIPCCTNQGFKSLIAKGHINNVFLFYQVLLNKNSFERLAVGSTFLEINKKDTSVIELEYPEDLDTQKQIANILVKVDEAIEKTEELIEKYEKIKQGMMHDLFTRGVDEDGKLRPSYEDAPELYQPSCYGPIPKTWQTNELKNLIQHHHSGIYIKKDLYGEGVDMVGVSDLYKVECVKDQDFRKAPLTPQDKLKFLLDEDDVIYGESSLVLEGIARTVWVEKEGKGKAFEWHSRRLSLDKAMVNGAFLSLQMNHARKIRQKIMSVATQTALTGITTKDLFSVEMLVPEIDEQIEIKKRIIQASELIIKEKNYLNKLQNQKSGLMQDLLTGKVSVNVKLKEAA